MKNLLLLAIASAALMSCQKETIDLGAEKNEIAAANAANAPKVVLPPSIAATKIYRCKDNSLVYIDWLSDKMTANFRAEKTGAPVQLKSAVAGEAMTAEGYSLTGDAAAASITLTRPEKGSQSCKG
ncbi:MAG: hypothetical protein M3R03_04190 [Pseudomonadota bacterium]|nr:hypothetical protein [Pseudomonadota bacterium]